VASAEVKVPDIGDFKNVEVIEVLVKPGDTIAKEQSLITLESDKATMEIPSPGAGVVKELRVKVGDKVSQGSPILMLDSAEAPQPAAKEAPKAAPSAPPARAAAGDVDCDVVVIGSGPGGYSAAFRAADLGLRTVLIERYPTLGGVCLNVGCIPSKALLHTAAIMDGARALADHGVTFGEPKLDLAKLRTFKNKVVGKLTGGLAAMAKMRKVTVIQGVASFTGPHELSIEVKGDKRSLRFANAIIAVGSQAAKLPFLPDDPRILDSTSALELPSVPKRMLIIGGGIIGLEMGTVYSTLGTRLDVVEMMDGLMLGADRDLVAVWQKYNAKRFDNIMLKTKTTKVEATAKGLRASFDGKEAQTYDLILVSVGRTPNGKKIAAEKAGVAVTDRGFIETDEQMRTNVPHIYAIGDVARNPMLAHKAVHEAHVAAEAAAGQKAFFDARVIPSVAYTDPEIAWVGITEEEAKKNGTNIGVAKFPWAASGRAIANARDEGFTKLIFDADSHRVLGGGIVGLGAGDLISEIALAVEMGADATDIGKTIHPHPTTSESVGMAAEAFEGVCTDLPPQRKR
jgi:dihydrolipoamide dehydrogenase